jgi:multisubunit Na+/H+ antiporter MnhB subunit
VIGLVAFDLLLVLLLVGLAWQVVRGRVLFRSIVFFVAFGLVMAMIWGRLGVPDLALAEAAIGAGLTGALMLAAFRRMVEIDRRQAVSGGLRPAPKLSLLLSLLAGFLVLVLGLTGLELRGGAGDAGRMALERLDVTGLENPVSAVLLLFRALDTVFEMLVLLGAYLGARHVALRDTRLGVAISSYRVPLVGALQAVVVPLALLVALHLLRAGATEPGGAFQAGAVLSAAAVLLTLTGRLHPEPDAGWPTRAALVVGTLALAGSGIVALLQGRALMGPPNKAAIYAIEAAMMISIGVTLALLFSASASLRPSRS